MGEINPEMPQCDVALVIGANDVVNPAARYAKHTPIYGMPIIDADKAKTVLAIKRSKNPGFAGIDNELYVQDRSEEHTSELQSLAYLVCRLLLEKKKKNYQHFCQNIMLFIHDRVTCSTIYVTD